MVTLKALTPMLVLVLMTKAEQLFSSLSRHVFSARVVAHFQDICVAFWLSSKTTKKSV